MSEFGLKLCLVVAGLAISACDRTPPVEDPVEAPEIEATETEIEESEAAEGEGGLPEIQPGPAARDPGLPGGFVPGDAATPGADIAYALAVDAIYEAYPSRALVARTTLEFQVVAGLNYQFVIERSGPEETRDIFHVRVYRDLQDNFEVTRVEKVQ